MKDKVILKNLTIAHRGIYNNIDVPENSIKSFEKALNKNVPIELDVHLTIDNQIVVFHDNNLERMTKCKNEIKNLTYQQLLDLNLLNTNEKIPLFKDVLKLINGKVLLDIEIKNDGRVKEINTLLTELLDNYKGQFLVKSFYPQYIIWFKKNRPNYLRGLLVTKKKELHYKLIDSKLFLNYLKLDFLAYNKNLIDSKKVKKIRKSGIPIFVWTLKKDDNMEIIKKYTDSYITENW